MKGRESSSNSREGGKPRWKDKRKGNFKIKWPCVRSGPITERKGGRQRKTQVRQCPSPFVYCRIQKSRLVQSHVFPKTDISVPFPVSHVSHTNDLLFSHTLRYKARYHSCVHKCAQDKPTNQLPLAFLRRARDVWILTSTTPTPLRFQFIFQRSDKFRTALFWAIMQRVVVIPYRRFGTAYRSHLFDP